MWHSFIALFVVLTVGLTAPANAKDRISPLLAYIDRDILSWVGDARFKEVLREAEVSWPDGSGSREIGITLAGSGPDEHRNHVRAVRDLLSQRVRESDGRIIYAALYGRDQNLIAVSNRHSSGNALDGRVVQIPIYGPGDRFLDGRKFAAVPVGKGDVVSLQLSEPLDNRLFGTLQIALKVDD